MVWIKQLKVVGVLIVQNSGNLVKNRMAKK